MWFNRRVSRVRALLIWRGPNITGTGSPSWPPSPGSESLIFRPPCSRPGVPCSAGSSNCMARTFLSPVFMESISRVNPGRCSRSRSQRLVLRPKRKRCARAMVPTSWTFTLKRL
uniref:Uncharacterized protein n=1 Tax=Cacopsylla melanoneura TaxID=428564 RepID=A0A8D9BT37_9HEMI